MLPSMHQGQEMMPVYIMSPMMRCGTNYLADILLLHPDFQLPRVMEEDFVFEHAHLLYEYGEKTYQRWRRLKWIDHPEEWRRQLQLCLGQGIFSFLTSQIDDHKRPLFKTPDSHNLDKMFLFFPGVKLVLLMRDGRDVVESAVRKWPDRSDEYWMQRWAEGARRILDFSQEGGRGSRGTAWELIRYEDLVEHPEVVVKRLLEFLAIDGSAFEWEKLPQLPVRGSSTILDLQGRVSQEAVEKPNDFAPIGRWQGWSVWRKRKFKKVAGRELIELGYESNGRW